ncbi:MAG: hypothetical protein HBSAPP02_19140 [Phycisphaerae bacterium]|nr:MAG: hypothetical protein HRU71_15495 [Planctomycetia bacterium]RIK66177.1 MAG: hypothetical protein DCC66_13510 [Planctomycetota bacterium]GJQ26882.1 MAG: hypothetical protein HBSAPP02_19140 [Phycisphaerae bacterium]
MKTSLQVIREWMVPGTAVAAMCVSAVCAVIAYSDAGSTLKQFHRVGVFLTDVAARAVAGTMTPQQVKAMETESLDLEQRLQDLRKPGLFQAQLVDAAGAAKLRVREIRPQPSQNEPGRPVTAPDAVVAPVYRILVEGSYREIAAFMDDVKRQRLPARVLGFRILAVVREDHSDAIGLPAEIDIEAYQPPAPAPSPEVKP